MPMTRRDFLAAGATGATVAAVASLSTSLNHRTTPFAVAAAQGRAYTLEPAPSGRTLKDANGRVVLTYLTSKPQGLAGNSACCIHPFNTLGGERATDLAPDDHPNHRGMFFAWHDMEFRRNAETLRGDFWGWGKFAPAEGRVIENKDVRLVRADASSGEIAIDNAWTIAGQTVLREATTIRASEAQATRVLDLTYRFTSEYDVKLNRMAFTGFCFRCRKEGPYTFADSKGEVTLPNSGATEPETDWPARNWYSHVVTIPGGKIVASAVLDHPGNPPSLWHGARSVSFLNPCITAPGPVEIPSGRALTLRYRAVVHDGRFPDGLLDKMAAEWRRS